MSVLVQLKQRRARVKGQITRIQTYFDAHRECSAADAQVRLKKVEDLWIAFEEIQQALENTVIKDEASAEQFARENEGERMVFEDRYYAVAAEAQRIVDKAKQPQVIVQQLGDNPAAIEDNRQLAPLERRKKTKLPEIKLPEFSGEYTKWLFFKNSFETTIHNEELSDPQKYQYLVGVLKGEAREVIEGFSSDHYEQAWLLLKATYDNEMMIIDTHLEELFNFPTVSKDDKADSMRQLVWHIQTHLSSLKALHQPVEYWDTIILHLARRKLEYTEQRDWQNCVKDRTPQNMPKLEDFIKFITGRCHTLRMVSQNKTAKAKQSAIQDKKGNKKVVLTSASGQCKICNGKHQTFLCRDLVKLSPEERQKCITEKRLCINCLNTGHLARECRASKCKKCSGRHNTVLHKEESKTTEQGESTATPVVTHCIEPADTAKDFCKNGKISQVILSTAQIYVRDVKGERVICRALLDPGSQSNLMTLDLLQRLKVPWTKGSMPISGVIPKLYEYKQDGSNSNGSHTRRICNYNGVSRFAFNHRANLSNEN